MDELDLGPPLAIRRALAAAPGFSVFALLILTTLSIGDHSEVELFVGVLAAIGALFILLLALTRALFPRVITAVAPVEVLTESMLLLLMVTLGGLALLESFYTAASATSPLFQSLFMLIGVGGIYVFM